jgi:hypothetical protein
MPSTLWITTTVALALSCITDAAVVQLGQGNFTEYFASLPPDTPTVVEFYASWCPHCRHFAPTYELLADYFMQDPAPAPVVRIARADCAVEVRPQPTGTGPVSRYSGHSIA